MSISSAEGHGFAAFEGLARGAAPCVSGWVSNKAQKRWRVAVDKMLAKALNRNGGGARAWRAAGGDTVPSGSMLL